MQDENVRPQTQMMRGRLSLGSSTLAALLLAAAVCQSVGATTDNPIPTDDPPEAQPLVNPFSPAGGLSNTFPPSVVFASALGGPSGHSAIRAVWSQVDAAWNARDAEQFSRLFAEDVSFRFVQRGQSLDGRATIFEHFHEGFPRYAPDLRHHTRITGTQPIAPGVFTADGKVEILRVSAGDDAAPSVLKTFAIFAVMSGKDEDWIIRALRIYQLSPAAEDTD